MIENLEGTERGTNNYYGNDAHYFFDPNDIIEAQGENITRVAVVICLKNLFVWTLSTNSHE